jgi:hypothetical protein
MVEAQCTGHRTSGPQYSKEEDGRKKKWDLFFLHAREDARDVAKPLCDALNATGKICCISVML